MKKLFLIGAFLVMAIGLSQTQGTIKGNVLDNEMQNEPLLFANVQLKGADKKTQTNFHGKFEFDTIAAGEYTLIVSYAGYESVEMPVVVEDGTITRLNLSLAAKTFELEDVAGLKTASKEKSSNTTGSE